MPGHGSPNTLFVAVTWQEVLPRHAFFTTLLEMLELQLLTLKLPHEPVGVP
jgi:hypothetical protein